MGSVLWGGAGHWGQCWVLGTVLCCGAVLGIGVSGMGSVVWGQCCAMGLVLWGQCCGVVLGIGVSTVLWGQCIGVGAVHWGQRCGGSAMGSLLWGSVLWGSVLCIGGSAVGSALCVWQGGGFPSHLDDDRPPNPSNAGGGEGSIPVAQ